MPSQINVVPIPFDRSSVKRFITFAWEIYKNDPHWVPPLIHDQQKILNPQKNPFFKHSEVQLFGAFENVQMVGRLAVGINQTSNRFRHENVAFFGFFESFNRPEIAQ
ncbi:MAG: GNAT family N-acetyltransferase, partial [Deltaproteobacteria bacterium]|nr:GNAT family N-acetyltransferase [Deltaproteobacteria bacterium]